MGAPQHPLLVSFRVYGLTCSDRLTLALRGQELHVGESADPSIVPCSVYNRLLQRPNHRMPAATAAHSEELLRHLLAAEQVAPDCLRSRFELGWLAWKDAQYESAYTSFEQVPTFRVMGCPVNIMETLSGMPVCMILPFRYVPERFLQFES